MGFTSHARKEILTMAAGSTFSDVAYKGQTAAIRCAKAVRKAGIKVD
ncbi:hypothetical protein RAMLITH_24050 [Ramlibacter sp. RBP-2]|uniref:Uncharacterized protein n=1 Tax=Ramlibacter lithotrophicus TaxID=2606681 RepID=A0A7X6DKK3_9BURK|nr:hypothetical protein [Ramlibacter lithotrophicus]